MITQLLSIFSAGLASSLSPCVYPMIPLTLGFLGLNSAKPRKLPIIIFALGQVITFTALGFLAAMTSQIFGFSSQSNIFNLIVGIFLIAFGLSSLTNYVPSFLLNLNSSSQRLGTSERGLIGAFLIGIGSALLASPCSSPILGSVLFTIADHGASFSALILMLSYSVGATLVFIVAGLGFVKISSLPKAGKWMIFLHKTTGTIIFLAGIYYLFRGLEIHWPV